jgi:hypothetical protein
MCVVKLGTWIGMSFSLETVIALPFIPSWHLCLNQRLGPPTMQGWGEPTSKLYWFIGGEGF